LRVIFLASTADDTLWFRRYYRQIFPSGAVAARDSLKRTLALIADNPMVGQPTHRSGNRKFPVLRTPFSVVYRISDDRIEVLRLLDQRNAATVTIPH
jgi:plasmid stabilization system protein ParE